MAIREPMAIGSGGRLVRLSGGAAVLGLFAATILLSAFLLFSVQPFFARMALPRLGGSPAVWSVAMVFFQAVLLAGYGWAHLLATRFSLRVAAFLHLCAMAAAFAFLPVALPDGWETPPETGQSMWLIGMFGASVGLPFFAVSANGPLLQAWFARTGHPHAGDPYFLYGASNLGSFASLILYIALFEPLTSVPAQSSAWTAGFAILALLIAASAAIAHRLGGASRGKGAAATSPALRAGMHIGWRQRLAWIALAALPSGLLVAVTAHVSVDIAAAPFLWVAPLALYLLTFVLAFARRPAIGVATLGELLPVLAALVFASLVFGRVVPVAAGLAIHLGFFFFAALLAHSVLAARRPPAGGLTEFYFCLSLGGVIGGAITTLVSPAAFTWVAEYPLLILLALFARPALHAAPSREVRIGLYAGALVALLTNMPALAGRLLPGEPAFFAFAAAGFAIAAVFLRRRSEAIALLFFLVAGGFLLGMQTSRATLFAERSFFGVVNVFKTDDGRFSVMAHGTTEHGAMRLDEAGAPPTPIAYYHESLGIASALRAAQAANAGKAAQIGAVGLGAGAMYCHRKPGETWTFFEIDRAVVRAASDPAAFRFMSECGQGDPIVVGDARLTLAAEPDGKFAFLLIDAFSSDSIPVHLLTAQALELYRRKLAPGGIVAFHISNRFMELQSVLAALAKQAGMAGRTGVFKPPEHLRSGEHVNASEVVALAEREADLGPILADARWRPLEAGDTSPWTDDYANIPGAIWRKAWR